MIIKPVPEHLVDHYSLTMAFTVVFNSVIMMGLFNSMLSGLGMAFVVGVTDYIWWKQYG